MSESNGVHRPAVDRLAMIREFLRGLTSHELYELKTYLIHEEQSKRRGIVVTRKPQTEGQT